MALKGGRTLLMIYVFDKDLVVLLSRDGNRIWLEN